MINWDSPIVQGADTDQQWDFVRVNRDRMLVESDWTQVNDAPVDQAAWAEYRQALRDLPASTTDPREAVWPTPPTV